MSEKITKHVLPFFGEIDTNALDKYYEAEIEINNSKISIDFSFEEETIKPENLKTIIRILNNINEFEKIAMKAIEKDFENGNEVKDYIEHHLEEIDFEDLNLKIDESDFVNSIEKGLLKKVHLVKISFYPEYEDEHIVFDYTIGKDLTDYLIVVKFNLKGEIEDVVMES